MCRLACEDTPWARLPYGHLVAQSWRTWSSLHRCMICCISIPYLETAGEQFASYNSTLPLHELWASSKACIAWSMLVSSPSLSWPDSGRAGIFPRLRFEDLVPLFANAEFWRLLLWLLSVAWEKISIMMQKCVVSLMKLAWKSNKYFLSKQRVAQHQQSWALDARSGSGFVASFAAYILCHSNRSAKGTARSSS